MIVKSRYGKSVHSELPHKIKTSIDKKYEETRKYYEQPTIIKTLIVCCHLGFLYWYERDYKNTLKYFKQALDKIDDLDNDNIVIASIIVGDIFKNNKDYTTAIQYYDIALEHMTTSKKDDPIRVEIFLTKANCLTDSLQLTSCLDVLYELKNDTKHSAYDSDYRTISTRAVIYDAIGQQMIKTKQYNKAQCYAQKSLHLKKKYLLKYHPSLALSYQIIGEIHADQKDYKQAIQNFEIAVQILIVNLPHDHIDIKRIYFQIVLYAEKGLFDKAVKTEQLAINGQLGTLPMHTLNTAKAWTNSLNKNERAIQLLQKTLPSNMNEIKYYLKQIASIFIKMGNIKQEMKSLTRDDNHLLESNTDQNTIESLTSLRCYMAAETYLEKILKQNDSGLRSIYIKVGESLENSSEILPSLEYYKRAILPYQINIYISYKIVLYLERIKNYRAAYQNCHTIHETWPMPVYSLIISNALLIKMHHLEILINNGKKNVNIVKQKHSNTEIAVAFLRLNDYDLAMKYFLKEIDEKTTELNNKESMDELQPNTFQRIKWKHQDQFQQFSKAS
ncbi:unnamed protein product [Didymodactylos carnosus]|uniref:Uncharacterized protein n=1 Tax=Didymodactylos carnosus TaxID=1234261 RepID=A0A8S2PAD1_9BILA|nr:unnamed protein product [Didymodactylos carnosus]CAF4043132.1 unnamed protein product [Didymodactylos carnosus]